MEGAGELHWTSRLRGYARVREVGREREGNEREGGGGEGTV